MKRQGWIGFFIGIVFCLLMVLPTSVQASLFISGDYDGYGTVLLNYENSPGGSGNFWDYTLNKDAYIAANTYLDGLAVNSNGWRIFNDGGEIYNNSYSGLIIGYPYSLMSGSLYNNSGYIEGTNGVKMGAGTVTNSGGIYGHDGYGIYQYSEGASPFTVSNGVYVPLIIEPPYDEYGGMTITPGTPETTGIGTIAGYGGGIYSYIGGAGSATVENAGVIMGYGGAGIGLYGNGTSTATVTNTGTIYGGYGGYDYAGVDIDGVLTATVTNSGVIDGDSEGVRIANTKTGSVTNNTGAKISGREGVDFYEVDNVTVNNSGSIRGRYGIDVNHADTVDITNNAGGTIRGQYGINIDDADTVNITNAGSIRGQYGIYIDDSGDVTITNNSGGTIRGQYGVYVENTDSAEVINNAGGTISGEYGVYMQYIGSADTAKVDNYGDIQGRYGISIFESLAAEVNNESTGKIEGRSYGVGIGGVESAEVTNSGSITSRQDDDDDDEYNFAVGIRYADTAKVTNNAGGTITSYNGRGIDMEYIGGAQTAEVVNSGTIQAWQEGVYIYESETAKVTNNEGGLIQSYSDYGVGMVFINDSAEVTNSGTIQAYKSGVGILGVNGPVTITNNSTGVIQGGYGGYGGLDDDDDMFPVSGVGILGIGSADVVNEGTIEGIFAGVAAYGAFGSDDDDDVPGTLSVTNSGIINGEYLGVGLGYADEATVINEENGMITGGGKGVSIFNVGIASVINEGTISGYGTMGDFVYGLYGVYSSGGEGANGYGIFITNPDDTMETATVANNGGVISGMGGNGDGTVYDDDDDYCYFYGCDGYGGEGYGVYVTNVKAVTVDNTGEINGTGGDGIGGDSGYGGYGSYGGNGVGGEAYGVLITDDWKIPTIEGVALYIIDDDDDATSMETATVTNSGVISGIGGNGIGGDGYFGGIGFGADGYGVYIANAQTVTIDNSGTIDGIGGDGYGGRGEVGYGGYGYGGSGYGVYIANAETAAVNNIGGTISGRSGSSDFNIDNYYDDDDDFAPLSIFDDDDDDSSAGIFMEWIPDVTVNNTGGTITGTHESVGFSAYSDAYGIYINSPWYSYTDTAEINNSGMVSGTASSYGYGGYSYAIANGAYIDDADTVTINNLSDGTITATAFAQSNFFEGQISAQGGFETEAEAAGLFIEEAYESATVTNYGTISAEATALDNTGYGGAFAGGGGVIIAYTAEATVDNIGGTISGTATADGSFAQAGGVGVGIGNYGSEAGDSATVNNTGTISGTATASGHYDDGEARSSGVMVGNFITVDVLNGAYMDEEENLVITGGTISGTATGNGYGYSGDSGYGYGYGVYFWSILNKEWIDTGEFSE